MSFWSEFYEIEVRDDIAQEFTDENGHVDDMMAGLHEIRARMAEEHAMKSEAQPARATLTVKPRQAERREPKRQKKPSARRVPVA